MRPSERQMIRSCCAFINWRCAGGARMIGFDRTILSIWGTLIPDKAESRTREFGGLGEHPLFTVGTTDTVACASSSR